MAKQSHRHALLELRAPQAGIIKDLATHTVGTVVSPGTVLMTVVPKDEPLRAEVMVKNDDIGFVRPDQPVKMKITTFQFQKYGTLDGKVIHVGPDSAEAGPAGAASTANNGADRHGKGAALGYRALVDLKDSAIEYSGERLALGPGVVSLFISPRLSRSIL